MVVLELLANYYVSDSGRLVNILGSIQTALRTLRLRYVLTPTVKDHITIRTQD